MPDILDQAKNTEMMLRENHIANALSSTEPPQEFADGCVICIDCDTPIPPARLAAKPNAARCIHCQQDNEFKGKHYERV